MTELTPRQIFNAIREALEETALRFAKREPAPTAERSQTGQLTRGTGVPYAERQPSKMMRALARCRRGNLVARHFAGAADFGAKTDDRPGIRRQYFAKSTRGETGSFGRRHKCDVSAIRLKGGSLDGHPEVAALRSGLPWRAAAGEDGQYCLAVAL